MGPPPDESILCRARQLTQDAQSRAIVIRQILHSWWKLFDFIMTFKSLSLHSRPFFSKMIFYNLNFNLDAIGEKQFRIQPICIKIKHKINTIVIFFLEN